eukprot:jgi/Pico_ML_1/53840/g4312.t2
MAMEEDALDVEALAARYAGAAKGAWNENAEEADLDVRLSHSAWVEATDRKAQQMQEKLERELAGYKTNLIKESIRMGHTDLGEFFFARGDYMDAFRSYVRTRDYCTTGKHVLWTCLGAIKAALAMGNAHHALSYVQKGEAVPDLANEPIVQAKFNAAAGLAQLMLHDYGMAGRRFCAVHPDLAQDPSWLVSPQDAAMYGALCALAFFGREEMRKRCIENVQFGQVLEHVPEIREMLHGMFSNQHAQGLEILDRLLPTLKLDKYLEEHLGSLQTEIRRRALVSYTLPFSTLRLESAARAFRTDIAGNANNRWRSCETVRREHARSETKHLMQIDVEERTVLTKGGRATAVYDAKDDARDGRLKSGVGPLGKKT